MTNTREDHGTCPVRGARALVVRYVVEGFSLLREQDVDLERLPLDDILHPSKERVTVKYDFHGERAPAYDHVSCSRCGRTDFPAEAHAALCRLVRETGQELSLVAEAGPGRLRFDNDAALAGFIRDLLKQAHGPAVFTICDFPDSEAMRDEGVINFADWAEQNAHRLGPGTEARKAADELQRYCDEWVRRTAHLRSD